MSNQDQTDRTERKTDFLSDIMRTVSENDPFYFFGKGEFVNEKSNQKARIFVMSFVLRKRKQAKTNIVSDFVGSKHYSRTDSLLLFLPRYLSVFSGSR